MSRIGKLAIAAPKGVDVKVGKDLITVKGPKGELKMALTDDVSVKLENGEVHVTPRDVEDRRSKAMWGTVRANINNMVHGVTTGFEKKLELVGVGYRAEAQGPNKLRLALGFSHPVIVDAPEGVTFEVPAPTRVIIKGIDKETVGQVAANIRSIRKPEPYKGKGVRYAGEKIRRKVGKTGK